MAIPYVLTRSHLYQWWLRVWYVSARTPRYRPLLRAEFANHDPFTQADFLFRAGYYNAAVCISRFAVEARLKRLVLITPKWKAVRGKSPAGILSFLSGLELMNRSTRSKFDKFFRKANKYVHETVVDKYVALKIITEAEELRPILDAMTSNALRQ